MRIRVLSDLHLEFLDFTPPKVDADVVVLAGDIHVGDKAIAWAFQHFAPTPVLYVLGNHEYYGEALPKHTLRMRELCAGSNVRLLENDAFDFGGVRFLGCTLWTDFELFGDPRIAGHHASQSMTDYRRIRVSPQYSKLRSIDTAGIHLNSRSWLQRELNDHDGGPLVVITHHAPSKRSIPARYESDLLSAAFASHMDATVEASNPQLWIHGHIHDSLDYQIGGTRVVCNPRGYEPDEPNPQFDPEMVVRVRASTQAA